MTSEEYFIEQLRQGNENAFRELIEIYKNKVFKTALSFVPFREDAEDISQEVFIEIFKSIKDFKQQSSLSTWVYRITVNKSLNYLKRNKKIFLHHSIDDYAIFDNLNNMNTSQNETSRSLEQKQLGKLIHEALEKLPERQKIVFIMHKIDGLPYKNIAEILGISLSSVESLIHRAKTKLQSILLRYVNEEY